MSTAESPSLSSASPNPDDDELYLVECGISGAIYQLHGVSSSLRRGVQIIVRTDRGLEFGTVLGTAASLGCSNLLVAKFVRRSQPEDRLLWDQLVQLSQESAKACQRFLDERGSQDVLLDVEPLLDGKTIFFHFLGEMSPSTEAFVEQLAEVYRQEIVSSDFANRLETGCGPGCGTAEKSNCGTGSGCSSCSLSGGCAVRKRPKS